MHRGVDDEVSLTEKSPGIDIHGHAGILARQKQLCTLVYEQFTQAKALIAWLASLVSLSSIYNI